jgi:hypothetical protein
MSAPRKLLLLTAPLLLLGVASLAAGQATPPPTPPPPQPPADITLVLQGNQRPLRLAFPAFDAGSLAGTAAGARWRVSTDAARHLADSRIFQIQGPAGSACDAHRRRR